MKIVTIHKADPIVTGKPIEETHIQIKKVLPKFNSLQDARECYKEDADILCDALKALSQGTRYELLIQLLGDAPNLYRGK